MSNPIPNPLAPRHRELDATEIQALAVDASHSDIEGALASLDSAIQDYELVYQHQQADTFGDEEYWTLREYATGLRAMLERHPKQKRAAA